MKRHIPGRNAGPARIKAAPLAENAYLPRVTNGTKAVKTTQFSSELSSL
jgi:hypothetical protein